MQTINVTKSYLPPFKKYEAYLKRLWKSHWLTNEGEFAKELEKKLNDFLGVRHLRIVSNGTIALQLSLKSLNVTGEVITTPFSYIASSSSIKLGGLKPVFADINRNSLNIDPENIRKKITKKTSAILAVHVFGNPCDVEEIQTIANEYNLKVIYDSAHAFGVKFKGKSILNHGDSNALSFHATKIFHTIEGGAVVSKSALVDKEVHHHRYFGHKTPYSFHNLGTNAKLSEFHAAMGLCLLEAFKTIRDRRKVITETYDRHFRGTRLIFPKFDSHVERNYSYYPVIFKNESLLKKVEKGLNQNKVFPRRYFYPSLNKIEFLNISKCEISEDISKRILCLPLSDSLKVAEAKKIGTIINNTI